MSQFHILYSCKKAIRFVCTYHLCSWVSPNILEIESNIRRKNRHCFWYELFHRITSLEYILGVSVFRVIIQLLYRLYSQITGKYFWCTVAVKFSYLKEVRFSKAYQTHWKDFVQLHMLYTFVSVPVVYLVAVDFFERLNYYYYPTLVEGEDV